MINVLCKGCYISRHSLPTANLYAVSQILSIAVERVLEYKATNNLKQKLEIQDHPSVTDQSINVNGD